MLPGTPGFEFWERQGGAFTTWDIQKKLGIKQSRLKEWLKYLPPSYKADGPGTKNLFSRTDLYKIFVFRELIDRGFSRQKAAELVNSMAEQGLRYASTLLSDAAGYRLEKSENGVTSSLIVDLLQVKAVVDGLIG